MPDSLFDKLDTQGEKIDQVAEKLDGVSIEDLYALAKRTWDYKDYKMAQKYYNHISLLRPLDWKAPFCASLCGCLGPYETYLWDRRPKEVIQYFQATVSYIQSRDVPDGEKNTQINEAADLISFVLEEYIRIYAIPENKEAFDKYAPTFKHELQKAFVSAIKLLEETGQNYQTLAKNLASFLSEYCIKDRSIIITKDDYERYIVPLKYEIAFDDGIDNSSSLSIEQQNEIKLKGKCYLVYKDKVLEKRYRRKHTILASILLLATGCSTLIPLLSRTNQWVSLSAMWLIPIALGTLFRSIGKRKGIRMDSIMNRERHKYRLRSDGNLICETVFSPAIICGALFCWVTGMFSIISAVTSLNSFSVLLGLVLFISFVLECVCMFAITIFNNTVSLVECSKRINYQGKWYSFDE